MDGEFLILDERNDRYMLLDKIQSADLIESFSSGCASVILNQLIRRKIVESGSEVDFRTFLNVVDNYAGVDNMTWAETARTISENHEIGIRTTFAALFFSTFSKALLTVGGLHRSLNLLRRHTTVGSLDEGRRSSRQPIDIQEAKLVAAAVYRAARYLPFKMQCLETSVAIKLWLDIKCIASHFNIGVQRYDFLAHAWVEVEGIPIGNDERVSRDLPKILKI
jgi:hypothetical protein